MKILVYLPSASAAAARLLEIMEAMRLPAPLEIHRSPAGFSERLRRMIGDIAVLLILVGAETDLARLMALKNRLADIRIILILPGCGKTMISQAHALYPRFISYIDSDFQDVAEVLRKMLASR